MDVCVAETGVLELIGPQSLKQLSGMLVNRQAIYLVSRVLELRHERPLTELLAKAPWSLDPSGEHGIQDAGSRRLARLAAALCISLRATASDLRAFELPIFHASRML